MRTATWKPTVSSGRSSPRFDPARTPRPMGGGVLSRRVQARARTRAHEMTKTIEEANKALVLEAFDTLFNKRDYVAAQRFWSPNYIQHSAHIAPGREGL